MDYFRITVDSMVTNAWFPTEPRRADGVEIDARAFTRCETYTGDVPLYLGSASRGRQLPITFGPFDIPILNDEVATTIQETARDQVQLVPAELDGSTGQILNVLHCVDCIDDQRTIGDKWDPTSGRPEKVGSYRTIVHLFIDPQRAAGAHVLRLRGWSLPLIVSSTIAMSIERLAVPGIKLIEVS